MHHQLQWVFQKVDGSLLASEWSQIMKLIRFYRFLIRLGSNALGGRSDLFYLQYHNSMSKHTFSSYPRWQENENLPTSASLIVNSTSPTSPSSASRLKLDDFLTRKKTRFHHPNAEDDTKRKFFRPFPSPELKDPHREKVYLSPQDRKVQFDKLKKMESTPFQSYSPGNNVVQKEGLISYRSQKALPSFLRNNGKVPEKRKPRGLCRENFKMIKKLGEGRFGTVFLARQIYSNFIVALKVMNKRKIMEDNLLGQFTRELKIQSFLDHPNIIRCYGYFVDQENFYALLELGCDGQLYDIVSSGATLTEDSTSFIIGSLLDAISLMHKHKILHRDIKPENVVLAHGNVKLCDFGWAVNKKEELRSTFCGTPLYLSPQLLKGQKYDEKVDLWAIGILAYELHLGCSPFDINEQEDLQKIVTDEVNFPKKVSLEFKEFILQILKKNPKDRLSCQDLMKLEFIRKYQQLQSCEELCQ